MVMLSASGSGGAQLTWQLTNSYLMLDKARSVTARSSAAMLLVAASTLHYYFSDLFFPPPRRGGLGRARPGVVSDLTFWQIFI